MVSVEIGQPAIWVGGFTLLGILLQGMFSAREATKRHRWDVEDRTRIAQESANRHDDTVNRLEVVRETVNGKMEALLKVTGDAREAAGKLAGAAEAKAPHHR